ncbi:carboxymuconolactone decarboxylase family protein [Saccharothrix obliqua]|uniref:carboxymuconolactone decarboxylase family protein n=1 Tax=Saccharothrix obliqua TaxID=2861747 RepID=UPI002151517B|nr:carboxymuconolactone decarboxylase family protein [Saccharothrix obliqua]
MKNPVAVLPDAMKAINQLIQAIQTGGVPQTTLELVHLRASQINGCTACVDFGLSSAKKAGEDLDRLVLLAAWRESDRFTAAERAALDLAEAATRLADRPDAVSDEVWAAATEHYDERGLAAITLMIAMTNLFNRINTTVRQPPVSTWSA